MNVAPSTLRPRPDAVLDAQLQVLSRADEIDPGTLDNIRDEGTKIFSQYPNFLETEFVPLLSELQKKAAAGQKLDNSDKAHIADLHARTNAIIQVLLFPGNAEVDEKGAQEIDGKKIAEKIGAEVQISEANIAILKGNGTFFARYPKNYVNIAGALAKAGRIKEALAYARKLPDGFLQASALRAIVTKGRTKKNQDEIAKIAQGIPHNIERGIALGEIAESLIKTGQLEKAMIFIKKVPQTIITARSHPLKLLVHELLKIPGNTIEQFKQTLPEQQQKLVTQMIDNRKKLLDLANAGVMKDRIEKALALPADQYNKTLGDIAHALIAKRKFEEADVVCMNLLGLPQVIAPLIQALIHKGRFALAEAWALTIDSWSYRILSNVSYSLLEKQRYEAAERVALRIHDPWARDHALHRICSLAIQAGNPLGGIHPISAIIDAGQRTRQLYDIAKDLLGDDNRTNDRKEEVVDKMLKAGAPRQELLNWGQDCLTPNIIRRVVYENLVPDSVIREKVKSLRAHRPDVLANMIDSELTRTLAIREEAIKEYSTRLGAAAFAGLEEVYLLHHLEI